MMLAEHQDEVAKYCMISKTAKSEVKRLPWMVNHRASGPVKVAPRALGYVQTMGRQSVSQLEQALQTHLKALGE